MIKLVKIGVIKLLYDRILVRFGDLTLKGKNQGKFIRKLYNLLEEKLEGLNVTIDKKHDHVFIILNDADTNEVVERLNLVSGIHSYSLVIKVERDIEDLKKKALEYLVGIVTKPTTFKVETKRADKGFSYGSLETSKIVSAHLLKNIANLSVDVHNPELTLKIEIRTEGIFIYTSQTRAMGGYPVGVAGKGLLMLSGGIDSPVAGYLAMKQGIEIECVHFESTPLTSIESAQKVIDLVKVIAKYAPKNRILVHMVPFKELHMALLDNIPEAYNITIMRRMMYRIATKLANKNNDLVLINGESVGQVASQTLQSMNTINSVTNIPVIRPLCTYDKVDIINISRKIGCFDISIKPFEDCCTVYVPKAPATAPTKEKAEAYEKKFAYEQLVEECVENTNSIWISKDSDLDLAMFGLEVREVLKELKK